VGSARIEEPAVLGRLVVLVEDGTEGRAYDLTSNQVDIGRSEGDVLLRDDEYVSPRHARLVRIDGRWHVRDLGSTNGVYARTRGRQPLESGDLILLGLQVLQFHPVSEAERNQGSALRQGAVQHGTRLFGSKPVRRLARLEQRTIEGVVADVYHLFRDETVIGREVGDIVFTSDPFLSRKHATIRRIEGVFTVEDLGSSNGTYLAIRGEVPLEDGDRIRVGQHLFRLDAAPASLARKGGAATPPQAGAREPHRGPESAS
jgi:pSer/pThr/pTyr-binding forkhead associated (FHA) protein